MADIDERRDQYVPLDSQIAFKRTGEALLKKWDMEGLCAWMLLLAAAKREPVQGTFTFASDAEAWSKIGAQPVGFTLDEFLTFLGRRKQTSRRRHGRLTYLEITNWGRWNAIFKRRRDAAQKSRKRGDPEPDIEATENGQASDIEATEVESEGEREGEEVRANALAARRIFEHWQKVWNHPRTDYSPERERLIRSRLKTYGEEKLLAAIDGSKLDVLRWPERAALPAHKLSVVLKDADHIEGFVALTVAPTSPNGVHTETEEDRERRLLAQLNQLGPKEAA